MKVIRDPATMAGELEERRRLGRTVGLVPTMGALHAGHTSLVRRAVTDGGTVVVSVFVNPLQFGPAEDLAAYPRRLDADVAAAAGAGADYVFAPTADDMYPEGFATTVHVGSLTERLEGAARPGHFDGVTTVVAKLLAVAGPCRAYFGEKDFQQLQVVRRLAADLLPAVIVVGCATVREPDGLALSSRNAYLSPVERGAAPVLHRALQAGAGAARALRCDDTVAERVRGVMGVEVASEPGVDLEYAELVDAASLGPPAPSGAWRVLIAARLGRTRLIDNLAV